MSGDVRVQAMHMQTDFEALNSGVLELSSTRTSCLHLITRFWCIPFVTFLTKMDVLGKLICQKGKEGTDLYWRICLQTHAVMLDREQAIRLIHCQCLCVIMPKPINIMSCLCVWYSCFANYARKKINEGTGRMCLNQNKYNFSTDGGLFEYLSI